MTGVGRLPKLSALAAAIQWGLELVSRAIRTRCTMGAFNDAPRLHSKPPASLMLHTWVNYTVG